MWSLLAGDVLGVQPPWEDLQLLGALLKHQHHGWNTTMPMPGIIIDGHNWSYFLFLESSGNLVCQKIFYLL